MHAYIETLVLHIMSKRFASDVFWVDNGSGIIITIFKRMYL